MHIQPSSVYSKFFSSSAEATDWKEFTSSPDDCHRSLFWTEPDIIVNDKNWVEEITEIAKTIFEIALFSYVLYPLVSQRIQKIGSYIPNVLTKDLPIQSLMSKISLEGIANKSMMLGLKALAMLIVSYKAVRYIVQRTIMFPLYPAQNSLFRFIPAFSTYRLNQRRIEVINRLSETDYIVREVCLQKNGIRYSGLLIGHKSTINNGKWALQATGNAEPIEHSALDFAEMYVEMKCNLLLINGPYVGKSEGMATPKTMGEAQEVGITFLESAIKAKKIIIAGRSLGGAAVGQAILQHEFKDDIKYLVVRQMTFDRASHIGAQHTAKLLPQETVKNIIKWAGCEMDLVEASKLLSKKGIKEIIVQCTKESWSPEDKEDFMTDGPIIDKASLGYALMNEGVTENKIFKGLPRFGHMTPAAIVIAGDEIQDL
ncbi:MAG: hypothetical protein K9M07_05810 [Simkaniaceae bacterium]|nr:hypothetical protein [Simkaniaceae bacterium]